MKQAQANSRVDQGYISMNILTALRYTVWI